ncbi:DUF3696 domain-containing protein [Sphingobium sufflavum]|uniref:DUF3696 domain-containing protein n=1 Tax=Sphingobium sufflavum TaxID=1129547 RepID=UPI001F483155|nr:DUF3696 domain-containing protein [Sphingobium sufflavum]MCE7797354.1 DUF3696 domain-containing protein [Sphingobium sufflavum]
MLKAISVQNYRGFSQPTTLHLRPLTILLGRNSSGKSSLTRLIPLLQQSLERQSSSPILWSSESVDLGNISDVITHDTAAAELRIGFQVSVPNFYAFLNRSRYGFVSTPGNPSADLEYTMRLSADGARTKFNGILIRIGEQTLSVDWDGDGNVTRFAVNDVEFPLGEARYKADTKSVFPEISRLFEKDEITHSARTPLFYDDIRPALENVIHGRTAAEKIDFFARHFSYLPREKAREALRQFPNAVSRKVSDHNSRVISDLSMINDLPRIMQTLNILVAPDLLASAYIGPSRASGKRFDRIQELSVDRLDASGDNTAMYVYSLSEEERQSFNDLLVRACGHVMQVEESGPGHVSIKVGRQGQAHFENIADVGFGFSQLVPVIAQLHAVRERNSNRSGLSGNSVVFAVEQPELHLHPAMQANLADLFVAAVSRTSSKDITTTILVETHSETLVSQLGVLIAEGEISSDDVAVYFVEKDERSGTSSLTEKKFGTDGLISDWPIGFFSSY